MTPRPLYVFGAGGHGRVVAEAALSTHHVRGFLDDNPRLWGRECHGLPVLGGLDALPLLESDAEVALGVGENGARAALGRALLARGRRLATVVHPRAFVGHGARMGDGAFVGALAALHVDAQAGRGVIVNTGAVVEHDARLGDWVHISPRAALGGGVQVGEGAHLGLGVVVLPGLAIGPWSTLGAGAVLTHPLPGGVVAKGVPARWPSVLGRTG
jgi:sugar O-acyltransferase (sialic acid O-acetyltransferase NeuD family)